MKVKLEFDTENPEEYMEFKQCVKAKDLALCLWEIAHNNKHVTSADYLKEKIYSNLEQFNIDLEDLF